MTTIIARRRPRTNVRIPLYTIDVVAHPTLGHVFVWPSQPVDPDERITLTESGRQLAREIIARRDQEAEQ